jgi:hypothetical protein
MHPVHGLSCNRVSHSRVPRHRQQERPRRHLLTCVPNCHTAAEPMHARDREHVCRCTDPAVAPRAPVLRWRTWSRVRHVPALSTLAPTLPARRCEYLRSAALGRGCCRIFNMSGRMGLKEIVQIPLFEFFKQQVLRPGAPACADVRVTQSCITACGSFSVVVLVFLADAELSLVDLMRRAHPEHLCHLHECEWCWVTRLLCMLRRTVQSSFCPVLCTLSKALCRIAKSAS